MNKMSDCPYCGAPAEVSQPFARVVKFLFWYIEIPRPFWLPACSHYCEKFMEVMPNVSGKTKREATDNWNKYVAEVNTEVITHE